MRTGPTSPGSMRRLEALTQTTGAVNAGSIAVQPQVEIRPNAGIGRRRPTWAFQATSVGTWHLDDFGLREHTAAQADDLYELISNRAVNHRSLILTSNRQPN